MLARFDERAATYDRENRFFHEDWDELRQSGYLLAAVPTEMGGSGLGLDEVPGSSAASPTTPRPPPSPSTCTSTGPAWPPTCCAPATSRAAGCSRRRPTARSSPPSTARPATTSRCCCRRRQPSGPTAAGRSTATRSSARSPPCGPTAGSTPWTPPTRPARGSCTASCARDAAGVQIVDTWDTLGMRATQSHDTVLDDVFVPDELVPIGLPGRLRRGRPVPGGHLRLGAARLRRRLPRRGPAGLRPHRRAHARSAPRSP